MSISILQIEINYSPLGAFWILPEYDMIVDSIQTAFARFDVDAKPGMVHIDTAYIGVHPYMYLSRAGVCMDPSACEYPHVHHSRLNMKNLANACLD